jgi:branched-chain amino acid transport system ATP-binding protein
VLDGRDVTRWPQPQRSRAGIGRTYQRTTIFPRFSVHENCRVAAQAQRQEPWRLWARASDDRATGERADAAIELTGLASSAARVAGTLAHGQKRQLEVAMCLATAPRVLLLDEPLAGMGAAESEQMLGLIDRLKPTHGILLVEHDMDAVFRIADWITVLANGAVVASDVPATIRANAEVQAAYLGEPA